MTEAKYTSPVRGLIKVLPQTSNNDWPLQVLDPGDVEDFIPSARSAFSLVQIGDIGECWSSKSAGQLEARPTFDRYAAIAEIRREDLFVLNSPVGFRCVIPSNGVLVADIPALRTLGNR